MGSEVQWSDIQFWAHKSSKLLIKKLSRNDCSWADGAENGHQNGVYIPDLIMKSGFFPSVKNVNEKKQHIHEARFTTLWPSGDQRKESNLKHYTNKGREVHFTGVPREEFSARTPASLLIGGALRSSEDGAFYWFFVIDSDSVEAELLETVFDLKSDFHADIFDPAIAASETDSDSELLIHELTEAVKTRTLSAFIDKASRLPSPEQLARDARKIYLSEVGCVDMDPFVMEAPGDAVMRISRDIEFSLYKRAELRHRAAEVLRIVTSGGEEPIRAIVEGFPALDRTFLSASQLRKSRAGRSFEVHIDRLLTDGKILFEAQAITSSRRPDFVLPSVGVLNDKKRSSIDALILSAKTTVRERWKQIALERFNCELFLATVDDRISTEAIADMQRNGICLVVPESLKKAKESCYKNHDNVIGFKDFFVNEVEKKRPGLRVK